MKNNGTYYLFVSANFYSRVDEYTSSNGRNWTLAHSNIIAKGSNHAWNSGAFGNNSGIVLNNKLYFFQEATPDNTTSWKTGLYTSKDFSTFTDNGSNPIIANLVGGPSLPYLVGDTWWIWLHGVTIGTGLPSDGYRYSAPAITGPWTQNPSKITLPRATQDEGVGSSVGQVADLFILEVGGRTYLYYTANSDGAFTNPDATAQIKLAIANMPISKLVTTDEYSLPSTTTAGSHRGAPRAQKVYGL